MNNQIQLYTSKDGKITLQVSFKQETVWLTQAQMADLFEVKPQNITMHLQYIYAESELDEISTCKNFLQVQKEGNRQVKRQRKLYNLDAIISVGYRISSKRATQFRQWATQTLKQFLVQGYAINERRLQEKGIEFSQAIAVFT
ncbi:RhuM family protein [Pasteurella multocida]